jgi:transposase InsO family protein
MTANAEVLTKRELADLAGLSTRSIERKVDPDVQAPVGRNGRPEPLYSTAVLQKVVTMPAKAEQGPQLSLGLTVTTGPKLSEADLAEAKRRFGIIEALLDREKYHLLYVQYPKVKDLLAYLAKVHGTPERTIYRWMQAFKDGGMPALVRRGRADKGIPKLMTDAARDFLVSLAIPRRGIYGALRVAEMHRAYCEERDWRAAHAGRVLSAFDRDKYARYLDADNKLVASAQLPAVSCRTFQEWFLRIPEMVRDMARSGFEEYKNFQEIITHRDIASVQPMDYVVMDHRRLDVFCLLKTREGWQLARPWLTAAIDMRTRKWLAWSIVATPSSDSIATVLKRVFIDHGLPKALYWDNGKDFICEWFEGSSRKQRQAAAVGELDTAWRGVLGTLGIRVHHAIVRNARAKLIEPNFNRISNFDRTLPEWCGHNPSARPERFELMVKDHEKWMAGEGPGPVFRTIEQIATLYSAALRDVNERELEGDGMRKILPTGRGWYSPNESWDVLIGRVERRTVPADVLQLCFAKRKELTVKHGEVVTTHDGRPYHYRMADNSVRLMQLNGKTVELAYDPLDLSEAALYYDGGFFGLVKCVALRKMGEQDFVQDEKDRRGARREIRKAIELVHHLAPVSSSEERLARRAEVLPARADVPRVEILAELPAPVMEQAAAVAEEKAFCFKDVVAEELKSTQSNDPELDDELTFFS